MKRNRRPIESSPASIPIAVPAETVTKTVSVNAEFDQKLDAAKNGEPVQEERRQDITDLVKQKRLDLKHVNVEVIVIRGSADEAATVLRRITRDRNVLHLVVYAQALIVLLEKLP